MTDEAELTEVRAEHRLDEARLAGYLESNLNGFRGPMVMKQFEGGQSNPTYLIQANAQRWVLRKKPPGELLKSAHAVEREFRVMQALGETDVPVPRVDLLCEDTDVLGTPFFVMDHVPGRIVMQPLESEMAPEHRRALYEDYIRVLACLHSVDYRAVGLGEGYGKPGNYFARQIGRWTSQYRASETDSIPQMDALIDWLPDNVPEAEAASIVHGDYTIRNMVVDPAEPRVVAVLDWELSTIGHPLGDLAYACMFYHSTELSQRELDDLGVPREQALIERYAEHTGLGAIENWHFYIAFCLFRLSAICQGVYKRGLDGNASSTTALDSRETAEKAARNGWAEVELS